MSNQKSSGANGKGYYIALALCALAIGVSGYLYYQNGSETPGDVPAIATDGKDTIGATLPNEKDPTTPTVPTKPKTGLEATASPLAGETLVDYAMDCLTYNPTTRDWRTHDGVDIAAQEGAKVFAAADGTVSSVYSDDAMGMTVVISHADGYVTKYACLSETVSVEPGDKVTMGQTIGTVGQTALMESALGHHLHFGVTCNGKTVDPTDFLKIGK